MNRAQYWAVLRGYVVINVPIENAKFLVTLENIHFYLTRESDGEDGYTTKRRRLIIWSETVRGYIQDNISNMEVYFNINIPKDKHQSGSIHEDEYGGYYWVLTVKEKTTLFSSLKRAYTVNIKS